MTRYYIEFRTLATTKYDSLAADTMRHLQARQQLGKAVIICDDPAVMLSAARKQWLKLCRALQRQRAGTLGADKILRYTQAIARMQSMGFSAKSPLDNPEAAVYFLRPDHAAVVPVYCWSVYVTAALAAEAIPELLAQLPHEALVVDYLRNRWPGAQPKAALEAEVSRRWQQVQQFLADYQIDERLLHAGAGASASERLDTALDALLAVGRQFLSVADDFRRALQLAGPLVVDKTLRARYDACILLAHRVQLLTPGAYGRSFLDSYHEDEGLFLRDIARGLLASTGESLPQAFARHMAAGRPHLAQGLLLALS